MHCPGTGDQIDRCFFLLKKPEEAAGQGHEDKAGLRETAGDLLWIPDLRELPRYLGAEIQAHTDYSKNDKGCYMGCGRFGKFGSYWGNRGLKWGRMGVTRRLAEWGSAGGDDNE